MPQLDLGAGPDVRRRKVDRNMQASEGTLTNREMVIAPDPSRSKYDIEIPWLIRGRRANPKALENLDIESLRVLFRDPAMVDSELHGEPVENYNRSAESGWSNALHQGLPSDIIVSHIAESIGNYTGINDSDKSVSSAVRMYLEKRCFGRTLSLNNSPEFVDLLRAGLSDYIARYLSREFMQIEYNPKCVEIALSSTNPFKWTHDVPLTRANKTIFNYVATLDHSEREFARFLDRSEDVLSFTSLGVTERESLVFQGMNKSLSSLLLPYDPDWAVVQYYNEEVWNWIIGTKHYSQKGDSKNEFMTAEWCELATQVTGKCWQYILIDPNTEFEQIPSFQALVVDNVLGVLASLRSTQRVSTTLEEILQMRDEGRR